MNYLISIYFDDKTDKRIRTYIAEAAVKSGNTYMLDHCVPPHITISAFETEEESAAVQALEECVGTFKSGKLQWVTIGAFQSSILYLAPVVNQYLHGLAVDVYTCIDTLPNVNVSKYYQPFQWFPHTTIGKKLTGQELSEGFTVLQSSFKMFEGKATRIGLAQKNPYREIREWQLN